MQFAETAELAGFRREVVSWLDDHLPEDWTGAAEDPAAHWQAARHFITDLAARHWVAPAWPREYGGAGLGVWEQAIFNEELGYRRAPNGINVISVGFAGPTIMQYGSDEQKKRFLPGIADGTEFWCQGFSEPDAGSDLASLRTGAERDGDVYRLNGRKTWTSYGHYADWMILLARTDASAPKHKGISYFIVPMDSKGLEIRPLANLAGNHRFNEVSLDDVEIPVSLRIGSENAGWYIATTTLDFERSSISAFGAIRRSLADLHQWAAGSKGAHHRHLFADLAISVEIGRLLSARVVSMQASGQIPNYEASIAKLFASETNQLVANARMRIMGLHGNVRTTSPQVVNLSDPVTSYLESVASTIAGGTSEVQRNIIATRGLGLPR
ncbi:MAG: acyl-CoA dehydrogenase family protein [Dehalococcoidia bacterium]